MPPLEDEIVHQCKWWWYSDQQIRTEDMTKFVNVPDCEEGYPLLKSELPPGNLMQQHAHHPRVYWAVEEPRITLGYLNFMYSKLVRIVKTTKDVVYLQKTVQWCVELLSTPDSRVRCLSAGILPLLAEIAQKEKDMYLMQQFAMCFKYASVRDVLVMKGKTLQFILKRINEETDRRNTIMALDVLSKCVIGLNCCKFAMEELLNDNAVSTALRLMDSPLLDLKEAATRFLSLICFHIKGKDQAIKQGAVEKLLPFLHHIEPRIQIFGLAALMSITIAVEGKFRIVLTGGVPYIKPMLDLTDDVIALYNMQTRHSTAQVHVTPKFVSMKDGPGGDYPLYLAYTSLSSAQHCAIHGLSDSHTLHEKFL